jgi:hypothetical protein
MGRGCPEPSMSNRSVVKTLHLYLLSILFCQRLSNVSERWPITAEETPVRCSERLLMAKLRGFLVNDYQ